MKSKLFLTALSASLVVPALAIPTAQASPTKFTDISPSYPYYKEINEMADLGIIKGSNGKFNPKQTLTRAHAATFTIRTAQVRDIKLSPQRSIAFSDVSTKNEHYQALQTLANFTLLDVKNGKIEPTKPLTRGEMSMILVNIFDLAEAFNYQDVPHPLTDVSEKYSFYVGILYEAGITTGSNGKFNEKDPLTREHFATFIYRTLQFLDQKAASEPARTNVLESDRYEDAAAIIKKWPFMNITGGGGRLINEATWPNPAVKKIYAHSIPRIIELYPNTQLTGVAGQIILRQKGWVSPGLGQFGQVQIDGNDMDSVKLYLDPAQPTSFRMMEEVLKDILPSDVDAVAAGNKLEVTANKLTAMEQETVGDNRVMETIELSNDLSIDVFYWFSSKQLDFVLPLN